MDLHTWWLFAVTVFVLSGTPGPNMLHVLTRSASLGVRRSVPAMAGCLTAVVVVLVTSAAGLGAVLQTSPRLFEGLRYLGVAYLAWLGIKAWRGAATVSEEPSPMPTPAVTNSRRQLFRGGLLIGLSNPKLLLFAAAFLPQFVDPQRAQWPQFSLLVATFAACELFWYTVYALGGGSLRRQLAKPALRRMFDRLTGAIFVGFGLLLLRFRPQ